MLSARRVCSQVLRIAHPNRNGYSPQRRVAFLAMGFAAVVFVLTAAASRAGEIHRAVEQGDLSTVERLLASSPVRASEPDADDPFRSLPLHFAARHGRLEIARRLLDAGAAVDAGDSDGSTALGVAALHRQPEMVDFLLARGADVNRRDRNGAYSLSFAASSGDSAGVERLLEAGADLNFLGTEGIRLIHYAALRGLDGLFDRLMAEGYDPGLTTVQGYTALHYAVLGGRAAMVGRLVDAGIDPSVADRDGETPLDLALWRDQLEPARVLLERGARLQPDPERPRNPLRPPAIRGNTDLVRLLLDHGVDPNESYQADETILMSAVGSGQLEVTRILLQAGARTTDTDAHHGCTALHLAALKGYQDLVALLLEQGADAAAADLRGRTPLDLALGYGHEETAALLARRTGASVPPASPARAGSPGSSDLPADAAVVRWLGHSGWAVETAEHLLIFDYHDAPRPPDAPAFRNGHVSPEEFGDKRVVVFVSHSHGDHFSPQIFDWSEQGSQVTYVLGFEPEETPPCPVEVIGPRQKRRFAGVEISTIESNDSGVGFLVQVDGIKVFHAGDHANRNRDLSGSYRPEIEWMIEAGQRPDIAFLPISGCNFGDQEAVRIGTHWTLEHLKPRVFCPMHSGEDGRRYAEFVGNCREQFPQVRMFAAEWRGDRFIYQGGEVEEDQAGL